MNIHVSFVDLETDKSALFDKIRHIVSNLCWEMKLEALFFKAREHYKRSESKWNIV